MLRVLNPAFRKLKIFPIMLVLSFGLYFLLIAAETPDKIPSETRSGKVIIRSIPLKCDVSFLDQNIHKETDQITIEAVPAGIHPIVFSLNDKTLKTDIDIQAGSVLLVNCNFEQNKVLVTPRVFVGKDGALMVLIPAGEFQMGSNEGEDDEVPVHKVYLDAFYMDIFEVTNAQYKKFMNATGYNAPRYWNDPRFNAPDQPVVGVTWHDAKAYCEWAGKRLPTEAEWEKAARGGLEGKTYPWGDGFVDALVEESSSVPANAAFIFQVGNSTPNNYGLYDMAGNAWEWCIDWYDDAYYAKSTGRNPAGPSAGKNRVLRGGSWFAGVYEPLRVAYRYSFNPEQTSDLIGFRCAASSDKSEKN